MRDAIGRAGRVFGRKVDALARAVATVLDLDGLIPALLLAVGADRMVPDSGLMVLGAALYGPYLIDILRRR